MTDGRQIITTSVLTVSLTVLVVIVAYIVFRARLIARNPWLSGIL